MSSTDSAEGKAPDDSLELFAEQDRVLVKIFDGWDAATPAPDIEDSRVLVKQGWERGTFGKLLIEHAAVRVAAKEDAALIRADLGIEPVRVLPAVAAALGDRRSLLARARHVESHAPTRPGADRRWYDDIGPLVRIHARYDRLRGFPWAESGPISDADLAERYGYPE